MTSDTCDEHGSCAQYAAYGEGCLELSAFPYWIRATRLPLAGNRAATGVGREPSWLALPVVQVPVVHVALSVGVSINDEERGLGMSYR